MIEKTEEWLEGLPAVIVSGILLALSFALSRSGRAPAVDPAWGTVAISGTPLLLETVERLRHGKGIGKISSPLLITLAMAASIAIGDLFAAGEVAFIMAVGEMLEDKASERARRGLSSLIALAPVQGRRLSGGQEELIPAETIAAGDVLRVLPGEIIPVDGKIISGSTSVDQSAITGESLPLDKTAGDEVFGGTLNCFGAVDIEAVCAGRDGSLQRLVRLMEEAEDPQAPTARLADRAASLLVPLALLTAVITGFITKDITRAVTVLVVFCPCALVLATPTAVMAAIGQAAKHGVLIKSGEALEKMGGVDLVALDKTGTLTCGRLEVSDLLPLDTDYDEHQLLALAAAAEAQSEHPLGQAIVAGARQKGLSWKEARDFRMNLGRGVSASVSGQTVLCGSEAFLESHGAAVPEAAKQKAGELRRQGKVALLAAADDKCAGVLGLADVLRPNAAQTVSSLQKLNTAVALLTGDHKHTAEYYAKQAGIEQVHAQLLPHEKVDRIAELQNTGRRVCMIGDGINDAPALKTARVGIAMGGAGSDLAVEAADIAFMNDDIAKLPYLKRLSQAALNTIAAGIAISLIINLTAVICSVLGWLNPTGGALIHNAGSCFVVLFAARLYDRQFAESQ